ncbi:hypothetical protein [Flavobacterium aquariorum]|jgi:hypothetical protein|uniref:hypothetical protein n=1 Tax=Flavobacterium aquariorum TaxID=2217670 RepID=UPI000F510688|nr:hypothetical protein [Flavobacterium aquariorum]
MFFPIAFLLKNKKNIKGHLGVPPIKKGANLTFVLVAPFFIAVGLSMPLWWLISIPHTVEIINFSGI